MSVKTRQDRVGPRTGARLAVPCRSDNRALRRTDVQSLRPSCHGIVPELRREGRLKKQAYRGDQSYGNRGQGARLGTVAGLRSGPLRLLSCGGPHAGGYAVDSRPGGTGEP